MSVFRVFTTVLDIDEVGVEHTIGMRIKGFQEAGYGFSFLSERHWKYTTVIESRGFRDFAMKRFGCSDEISTTGQGIMGLWMMSFFLGTFI